jgi:hypothetical protein
LPNKGPSDPSIGERGPEVKADSTPVPESFENDRQIPYNMVDESGRVVRPADDFTADSPAGGRGGARRAGGGAGGRKPDAYPYGPMSTPTDRTSAQRPDTTPGSVATQLRSIRRRGVRDAEGLSTIRSAMDKLSSALNLSDPRVSAGETSRRKAEAFWRHLRGGTVLNRPDNYQAYLHEIGHAVHEMLWPEMRNRLVEGKRVDTLFPEHWHKELFDLGKALYGEREPKTGYASEGWAEAIRKLMLEPAALKRQAPTVYKELAGMLMERAPEVYNSLLVFRARIKSGLADSERPLLRYLHNPNAKEPRFWGELADQYLVAPMLDRYIAVKRVMQDLDIKNLRPSEDPEIAIRTMAGKIPGHFNALVKYGPWDLTTHDRKGAGIVEIFDPIRGRLDDWKMYQIAKRVKEKRGQGFGGIMSHVTDAELDAVIAKGDADPALKKASDQFRELNHWLINDYAVHYGLIDADAAERITEKNLDYITFRYNDRSSLPGELLGKGRKSLTDQSSGINRFKGSSEELLDPLDSFLEHAAGIMRRAQMNHAAKLLFSDLWKGGHAEISRWFERIPPPKEAMAVQGAQYRDRLRSDLSMAGVWGELGQEAQDKLIDHIEGLTGPTFFRDARAGSQMSKGIVSVLVNGKREWYQINNEMLARMMSGVENPYTPGEVMKWLTLPAKMLRAGATQLNPTFMLTNSVRDLMDAVTMTAAERRGLGPQAAERLRQIRSPVARFKCGNTWWIRWFVSISDLMAPSCFLGWACVADR